MSDTTPAAEIAALSRSADFLAGNPAAVAKMFQLHEAAQQGGFPAPGESAPAEPTPSTPAAADAPSGRYKPEDYTLEMTLDQASPEAAVAVQTEARQLAAALDLEPDLARGGSELLDRAIATRGGRPMDGIELARLESLLERQAGGDLDRVLDAFEARLRAAGPAHAARMKQLLLASGPAAGAWAILSLGTPTR